MCAIIRQQLFIQIVAALSSTFIAVSLNIRFFPHFHVYLIWVISIGYICYFFDRVFFLGFFMYSVEIKYRCIDIPKPVVK